MPSLAGNDYEEKGETAGKKSANEKKLFV